MATYYTIEDSHYREEKQTSQFARILTYGALAAAMCIGAAAYSDLTELIVIGKPTSGTLSDFISKNPPAKRWGEHQMKKTVKEVKVEENPKANIPLSLDTLSSRVDRPIVIPSDVKLTRKDGILLVEGPKGKLQRPIPDEVILRQENGILLVAFESTMRKNKAFFGLYRALIANMVTGVSTGFSKKMEMIGVGYRGRVEGRNLILQVGKSHDVVMPIPDGLTVTVEENTKLTISGINREQVGQFCANVRMERPPEPYKGKGIRYDGEKIILKAGKGGKGKK